MGYEDNRSRFVAQMSALVEMAMNELIRSAEKMASVDFIPTNDSWTPEMRYLSDKESRLLDKFTFKHYQHCMRRYMKRRKRCAFN